MRDGTHGKTCETCKWFVDTIIARCGHENGLTAPQFHLSCRYHEPDASVVDMQSQARGTVNPVAQWQAAMTMQPITPYATSLTCQMCHCVSVTHWMYNDGSSAYYSCGNCFGKWK